MPKNNRAGTGVFLLFLCTFTKKNSIFYDFLDKTRDYFYNIH